MHNYIVNASLQVVPVATEKHPYVWVDEAIEVVKQSGIKYEVGAFATVIEGTYIELMKVFNDVNEYLLNNKCHEWIVNFQLQLRAENDITAAEKTEKFKH